MSELLRKLRVWWFCRMGFHRPSHSTWRDDYDMICATCLNCRHNLVLTHANRWIRVES